MCGMNTYVYVCIYIGVYTEGAKKSVHILRKKKT